MDRSRKSNSETHKSKKVNSAAVLGQVIGLNLIGWDLKQSLPLSAVIWRCIEQCFSYFFLFLDLFQVS